MKNPVSLLPLLILLCQYLPAVAQPLKLVTHRTSSYRIVIPAAATETERRAAELLQQGIEKVSGCRLPLATDESPRGKSEICVGFTNRSGKEAAPESFSDPDGFRICTRGKRLLITGGSHKGVYYGVVDLLEKQLGCLMLAPGLESFPGREDIRIPRPDYQDAPANRLRIVNGRFSGNAAYKEWMRLDETNEVFADRYYVHTFNRLVPWQTWFGTHPEYFALMNGKRIIDQLCMSEPRVLELVVQQLKEEMALQPDRKVWSVSQNDNFSYCQCDRCKAVIAEEGAPSGPLLRFVNQVASRFPDQTISTLAYQFSRAAPALTRPADNVQIVLCTIELNRSRSIESDPGSSSFVKDMADWGKLTDNLYLWDYTIDFANSVSPFPNLHVLQPNLQYFTRSGARQHFQQTNTMHGNEMAELKSFLIARLLWNPDVNTDSVKTLFLNRYYEEAAPYIRAYLDRLESELIRSGDWLDIYGSPVHHRNSFLSQENTDQYNRLFDQAEASVSGKPEILQRVKVCRLPLQFALMEIGKNDMFGPRGWYSETGSHFVLRPEMKATLEDFYRCCQHDSIRYLNESGLTAESYYDATLRFIDVQTEGNLAFRKTTEARPAPAAKYSGGELSVLTNGVQGADSYKVHWLGWECQDFSLTLDLERSSDFTYIRLGSLWDPKSWILHPARVSCMVSPDGIRWMPAGVQDVPGDQQKENVIREYIFRGNFSGMRYVRFYVTDTKYLPSWHPSAGGKSWVFVDEIVIR
jgi:hypothetical protein